VFSSTREGRENLYVKSANGATEEKKLFDAWALFTRAETWTPDGSALVFNTLTRATGLDLWLYPMKGDGKPKPLLQTRFNESNANISPDGHWISYRSNETGRSEMYVRSFPDMGVKVRISDDALGTMDAGVLFWTEWSRDGKEIVFPGTDAQTVVSVTVSTAGGFHAEPPRALFRLPLTSYNTMLVTVPGGGKFLLFGADAGAIPTAHTVILNWTALLSQK